MDFDLGELTPITFKRLREILNGAEATEEDRNGLDNLELGVTLAVIYM
jgi:hypothetical protein